MNSFVRGALSAGLFALTFGAFAQKPIIYPAKGQSAAQQSKDDGECYVWSKQQSGYDPVNPAQAAPTPAAAPAAPPPPRGGMVKGAVVGATVGAIGDNDVGEAAAKGAVVGGVAQAARRRGQLEASAQQQQVAQQQQTQSQQGQAETYRRAYSACMSGRGYTVN
jgi:hypothetical protein